MTFALLTTAALVFVIALPVLALRFRRRKNDEEANEPGAGFRPDIGFSDLDGMTTLSLLLANKTDAEVWVEKLEIFLAELDATYQAGRPSYYGVQTIREALGPDEHTSISLSAAVYKASGECQRWYSFVLSSVVRYRIGEQRLEKRLADYRVEMMGFITSSLRREREPMRTLRTEIKPQGEHLLDAKPSSSQ